MYRQMKIRLAVRFALFVVGATSLIFFFVWASFSGHASRADKNLVAEKVERAYCEKAGLKTPHWIHNSFYCGDVLGKLTPFIPPTCNMNTLDPHACREAESSEAH